MNYYDLKSEIREDLKSGHLQEEDIIYIIRKSHPVDGYYPIIDFEYNAMDEEDCEAITVKEVLEEMEAHTGLKIIK